MVAGLDDHGCKSELFLDIAKERMDCAGKTNYELYKYPGLGHIVDAPFMPPALATPHPLVPKGMLVYYGGKDSLQHSISQLEVWKKVISFFTKSLKQQKSKL